MRKVEENSFQMPCPLVGARVRITSPALPSTMKQTGPTNSELATLIEQLKTRSREQEVQLWRQVAKDLERPTRKRRVVNLSRLNRFTKENETVVVPGKVLGAGALGHKLTVAAFQVSADAEKKMKDAGCTVVNLLEISKEKPQGKKIRIIG